MLFLVESVVSTRNGTFKDDNGKEKQSLIFLKKASLGREQVNFGFTRHPQPYGLQP